MRNKTSKDLIADAVRANCEFKASLRQVINGYIDEMGGADSWGRDLAKTAKDEDIQIASRVSLQNNILRLFAQLAPPENEDDMIDEEQIEAQLEALAGEQEDEA